jgi:hypothetical protein
MGTEHGDDNPSSQKEKLECYTVIKGLGYGSIPCHNLKQQFLEDLYGVWWIILNCVEFEVLTAMTMKSMVFRVVTPCSSEKARRFGGIYRLHRQCRKIIQARNHDRQASRLAKHVHYSVLSKTEEQNSFFSYLLLRQLFRIILLYINK